MLILRLSFFYSLSFFEKILLCMQVFGRGARGPKHPVDSEVSTLIIRTSQVELVSQGQAPIKGLHLSLLAARPMLAFRSILIPGPERWTPPALPGLWKPHRSRIPIPGRPVRYPSESQSGRRGALSPACVVGWIPLRTHPPKDADEAIRHRAT